MTIGFPLLLIPLAIYNIVAFLMPGVSFTATIAAVRLWSGAEWTITFGDLLLALGLLLLLFEVVKAARPGAKYLTDHLLSLLVFGGALAEFLLLSAFGTSTFALLTAMTGVDFLASAAIALRHRKYRVADELPADGAGVAKDDRTGRPIAEEPAGMTPETVPQETIRQDPPLSSLVTSAAPTASQAVAPPTGNISPAVHDASTAAKSGQNVSEWSVADLVHDTDHPGATKTPTSSEKPPAAG